MKVKTSSLVWIILIIVVVTLFTCMSCKSKEGFDAKTPIKSCNEFVTKFSNAFADEVFSGDFKSQINSEIGKRMQDIKNKIDPRDISEYNQLLKKLNCSSFPKILDTPLFESIIKKRAASFFSSLSK